MQTTSLLAAFGLGGGELMVILAIVLLLFGSTKLPQLAKGLGQSVKEFKKATKEGNDDDAPKSGGSAVTVEAKKTDSAKSASGSN